MSTHSVHIANVAAAVPTVATFFGYLPTTLGVIATLLAAILYGLQIYDWFEQRCRKDTKAPPPTDGSPK